MSAIAQAREFIKKKEAKHEQDMAMARQAGPQGNPNLTRQQGGRAGYVDFYGNTPDELREIADNAKKNKGISTGTEMAEARASIREKTGKDPLDKSNKRKKMQTIMGGGSSSGADSSASILSKNKLGV